MPKDQTTIAIAVLDEDRPPTAADFLRHLRVGKMRFTVKFMDSDRHKIGYLKSTWLTRRGLASPESEPLKFRVI